jgi:hypothetical protein
MAAMASAVRLLERTARERTRTAQVLERTLWLRIPTERLLDRT